MNENDSTLQNFTASTGDIIETQEAVANAIKTPEEIVAEYDNKIQSEINRSIPMPEARNRAERRAMKFNKKKRDHIKHLDELRKNIQVQMYMDAIRKMQNFDKKLEEKLSDTDKTDLGV